ncbi:MAG: adenylate/guanylate cyclase domain-containing protein [Deltaproteobacteria bacterium]|nr:adenylate/guanylate cyclase domain-containing protein [Deltaproteobacteria bacterium]
MTPSPAQDLPTAVSGQDEVDAILAAHRARFDRSLARVRAISYGVFAVTSAWPDEGSRARWTSMGWRATAPALWWLAMALLATAMWWGLRRRALGRVLATLLFLFDLAAFSLFTDMANLAGTIPAPFDRDYSFMAFGVPSMMMAQTLHALRNDRRTTLLQGVFAAGATLALTVPFRGPEAHYLILAVAVAVFGWLLSVGNVQQREILEGFARLNLLRRFLPGAAVDKVLALDPAEALAPGGRLQTLTILVSDLRGFTALSETLPPERIVQLLNEHHGAMVREVERHGGVVDKFMGDGALILFGLDDGDPGDAARQAIACARAQLQAMAQANAARDMPLAMGIGIHSGPVVVGNIGAGRRLEHTVIGDAVNTASRLEAATKTCGVPLLVSQATVDLAGAAGLRALEPVMLRGKSEALGVWTVD